MDVKSLLKNINLNSKSTISVNTIQENTNAKSKPIKNKGHHRTVSCYIIKSFIDNQNNFLNFCLNNEAPRSVAKRKNTYKEEKKINLNDENDSNGSKSLISYNDDFNNEGGGKNDDGINKDLNLNMKNNNKDNINKSRQNNKYNNNTENKGSFIISNNSNNTSIIKNKKNIFCLKNSTQNKGKINLSNKAKFRSNSDCIPSYLKNKKVASLNNSNENSEKDKTEKEIINKKKCKTNITEENTAIFSYKNSGFITLKNTLKYSKDNESRMTSSYMMALMEFDEFLCNKHNANYLLNESIIEEEKNDVTDNKSKLENNENIQNNDNNKKNNKNTQVNQINKNKKQIHQNTKSKYNSPKTENKTNKFTIEIKGSNKLNKTGKISKINKSNKLNENSKIILNSPTKNNDTLKLSTQKSKFKNPKVYHKKTQSNNQQISLHKLLFNLNKTNSNQNSQILFTSINSHKSNNSKIEDKMQLINKKRSSVKIVNLNKDLTKPNKKSKVPIYSEIKVGSMTKYNYKIKPKNLLSSLSKAERLLSGSKNNNKIVKKTKPLIKSKISNKKPNKK